MIFYLGFFQIWIKIWSQHKNDPCFFLKLSLVILTLEIRAIHENAITIIFFKWVFYSSSSSSTFIYNIAIVIKTPTTINNQFQALYAPKINIQIFIFSFFTHINHFPFTLFPISSKNPNFCCLIRITQVHNLWSRTSEWLFNRSHVCL